MARGQTEKMLGANLPGKFVEQFWKKAAPEGTSKNRIVEAMARLWLDSPAEVRRQYLYPEEKGRGSLSKLIEKAVIDFFAQMQDKTDDPDLANAVNKAIASHEGRKAAGKKSSGGRSRKAR